MKPPGDLQEAILEVVGAVLSGSLALLADAAHMLTDVAGLTLGLIAAVLARRPATPARTWGYHRAEVLGAAAQAALLLAVGAFVLIEGVKRLFEPPEVASGLMIVFGIVGLIGNLIGLLILASGRSANLNMRLPPDRGGIGYKESHAREETEVRSGVPGGCGQAGQRDR